MGKKSCTTCRHYAAPASNVCADDHCCMHQEIRFKTFDPLKGRLVDVKKFQKCRFERSPGFIASLIYGLMELRKPYCGKHALWHEPT